LFYWFKYCLKADAILADEVKKWSGAGLSGIALGRHTGRAGAPVAMMRVFKNIRRNMICF
jgi:hypothetical protein